MKEKLRMILAVTGIFLLLPLLLTVFLSGREALHIKKQWNMESLLPMLMCREIPWEYEEEMKKVQAVLTRSSLYFFHLLLILPGDFPAHQHWEEGFHIPLFFYMQCLSA